MKKYSQKLVWIWEDFKPAEEDKVRMSDKIKVGLVGIGNCFSGLIQGIEYYRKKPSQKVIGIIHQELSGYGIHDIDFVCGFEVGENKIGKTRSLIIFWQTLKKS